MIVEIPRPDGPHSSLLHHETVSKPGDPPGPHGEAISAARCLETGNGVGG